MGQTIAREDLAKLGERLRQEGKTIVCTNGCFDILHIGHARILQQSRSQGDVLVVGINSDSSVSNLKGPSRPINNESDRADLLCHLSSVDYVTVFSEQTACELLSALKPHIYVKGADYTPENLPESEVLKSLNTKLVLLPLVPGRSTTSLVEKIKDK